MDQSIVVRQDTNTSDTKSEEMSHHASSVKEESDDDERQECPEGITCGLRSYQVHKSKYKHMHPASKGKDTPEGN